MTAEEFKFMKPGEVRTRMAPSPTGFFHIGGARTALFNYLFAKQKGGSFILRIEDTDTERSKPEYSQDIQDSLKWLGIEWDEGPGIEGKYGPYLQSQRKEIYAKYLKKLLEENKAYYCFCSEEELETQRQYQMSQGLAPRYSGKCADLPQETAKKYLQEKRPAVIRFRMPSKKVKFQDLIRGQVEFDAALMGDVVIAKDLNNPLYNFAVVVDDFEMKISHVIRGEEHLSNTPRQILFHEALNLPQPQYAHLPMILAPDRSKLSKRYGTTGVREYRQAGYLPETLINFMAFLGWNPGDEREIYSLASLVKEFSLEKVQRGGAIFNIKRLDFLNGFYIRQKSIEKLTDLCLPYLKEAGLITQDYDLEKIKKIIAIYQERLKKLSEIVELSDYFFREILNYNRGLLKWKDMQDKEIKKSLEKLEKVLSKIKDEDWKKENLENVLMPEAEKDGDRGVLLWPLRVALTGKEASAGPFEVADILGKEKTLKRIKIAKELLR